MKQSIATVLIVIAAGLLQSADPQFDAAAATKKLAPFLDEQVFAVGRIDLADMNVDQWFKRATKWVGLPENHFPEARTTARSIHGVLQKIGAREIYVVLSLADLPSPGPYYLVPVTSDSAPLGPRGEKYAVAPAIAQSLRAEASWLTNGVVAAGPMSTIERLKKLTPSPRPDLAKALAAFPNSTAQLALVPGTDQRRVVEEMLPKLPAEIGGGSSTVLTRGIQWAAIGIESKPTAQASLVVQCKEASAAEAVQEIAAKAVVYAAQAGKEIDLNLAAMVPILTPKVSGDRLTLTVNEGDESVAKLIARTAEKTRAASGRVTSMNNLKQIALAMHSYADGYRGEMVPHAIYSKDGKTPLLSWRVALLPWVEQDAFLKEFKLDEPWDSEHNKKLIGKMPKVYLDPLAPPATEPGMTHYQLFVGPKAAWQKSAKGPMLPKSFPDGTSNTIMIAEAREPVIWTKPDDMTFDPDGPLPKLGINPKLGFLAAMGDGSVRVVGPKVSEKTIRAAITASGNETLGVDW